MTQTPSALTSSKLPVTHSVTLDHATNMIRITAGGFWSPEQFARNAREAERVLAVARTSALLVRVLIDVRRSTVQSTETADRIRANALKMYRPDERVAVVVASELARMQAKRLQAGATNRSAFLSLAEAEAWLMAPG